MIVLRDRETLLAARKCRKCAATDGMMSFQESTAPNQERPRLIPGTPEQEVLLQASMLRSSYRCFLPEIAEPVAERRFRYMYTRLQIGGFMFVPLA
jgi:hypothetical protein